ncbi:MAG: hypothetical protein ACHQF2_10495 [Flavobacteriales bacterium]
MNNEHNIEQLFRSTFETFEAPVDPSVWTAVQSGIAAKGAATAVAAKTGIIKTIIISGTTLITGLGLGYVFFGNTGNETTGKDDEYTSSATSHEASTSVSTNETGNNNTPPSQKMVDVVIPVENKTTGKKEMITIKVPESRYINKSIVDDQRSKSDPELWNA